MEKWDLQPRTHPSDRKAVKTHYIYKAKRTVGGEVGRYKARLVRTTSRNRKESTSSRLSARSSVSM